MVRLFVRVLCVVIFCAGAADGQAKRTVKYGADPAAGHTFVHDGVTLYYETYGTGEPLLLVHGNGGSIGNFSAQIEHFRKHYRVIAMDSREQGKSGSSAAPINYEVMTDDLAALLDHLHTPPVYVLGWSDGGIESLLMGIRHPEKVKKIVSMAANLYPSGAHPDALTMVHSMLDAVPAAERATPQGKRELKVVQMMLDEPHIKPEALEVIKVPVLVLASDHDLISDDHTLEIYHHLSNAQLNIFANATHTIPYDEPERFDAVVDRFLATPFVKKDRVKDALASFEKMEAESK